MSEPTPSPTGSGAVATDPAPRRTVWDVVSRSEARLLFWLVMVALLAVIATLSAGFFAVLATPALVLFIAWLMAYVLEPLVSWLQRHLPFKRRGMAVAITYLVTAVTAFVVLAGAGIAMLQAAIAFVENLPAITARLREALEPIFAFFGITMPSGGSASDAIAAWLQENGAALADAVTSAIRNMFLVIAGLITAVIISVGLAVGQVSLLGWMKRFLPSSTYVDLTNLERAIAVSFGGFVRGRLLIGAIFGAVVLVAALVFDVPLAPLIAVIAGLIVFIPWIGPLIGWAVLPAFAFVFNPDVVVPCLVVSLVAAVAIQLFVTQLVMGAAVHVPVVAVFAVVFLGTSVAGVLGAIFAIPVAAAILAVTDYLRQRDVLLRSEEVTAEEEAAAGVAPADGVGAAEAATVAAARTSPEAGRPAGNA
jgi:predicted PurR-regulated permease PerM